MTINEVREKFLEFYKARGHEVIPSAPLVPENDPTTLFTGSGMQPLVPFLLGEKHPKGTRLVDSQKSFRSGDIEDIGDNRHTTFFEMLGNWSLGDYFKQEQLPWVFEFLTKEIGLDPSKLYVTVFQGDKSLGIPKDDESIEIWKKNFKEVGIEADDVVIGSEADGYTKGIEGNQRIFAYDAAKNWWSRSGVPENMPTGEPGGPDSEIFYEFTHIEHDTSFGERCHPNCDCGRFIEIGNSVFMEYQKQADGSFTKLPQKNVDFGGGLERIAAVSIDSPDVFKIDVFKNVIAELEKLSGKSYDDKTYTTSFRVILDHIRAAAFLIGDGVLPGNSDQGYFVRRLIRRAVRFWDKLDIENAGISLMIEPIQSSYKDAYADTWNMREQIISYVAQEEERFRKTLAQGLKQFEKITQGTNQISGNDAFILFSTYGFPVEVTEEIANEKGITVDKAGFEAEMKNHQDLSRTGAEGKFKGGLGDTSEMSVKYHTATHLLHQALHEVLGDHVEQKGSNITPERLRFDFSHPEKMTDEQKQRVEDIVNQKIQEDLPVHKVIMPKEEALKIGAMHFFGDKYGDEVSVYYIGDSLENAYSKEFCGGPHVERTGILGHFKIKKEESVAQGIRRIKAILE